MRNIYKYTNTTISNMETKTIKLEKIELKEIAIMYLNKAQDYSNKIMICDRQYETTDDNKYLEESKRLGNLVDIALKQHDKFLKIHDTF